MTDKKFIETFSLHGKTRAEVKRMKRWFEENKKYIKGKLDAGVFDIWKKKEMTEKT